MIADAESSQLRSANADWVRALQRTADIAPDGTRTLADIVDAHAHQSPEHPALAGEDADLTYAGLAARANRYARWAAGEGLQPGDRVALLLDNCPDYAAIWLGLTRRGIVVALINTHLTENGLAHCLTLAAARHIIVGAAHLMKLTASVLPGDARVWVHGAGETTDPRIDTFVETLPGDAIEPPSPPIGLADTALLIYTSGTTGLPKAAFVSHFRIVTWSEWFAGIMDAGPTDRLYNCLPMYHSIGGVVAVGAMLAAGGTVIVRSGFSARHFWPDVVRSHATIFQYIGELCRYLLNAPACEASESHRLRLCCGNGLRGDVWERFAARFHVPRIIEFYAATEGSFSLFNLEGKPGAIGRVPRFMAHRSPVALVRFDVASERPVRDAGGFCIRCATNEVGEAIGRLAERSSGLANLFEGYTSTADSERKILRDVFASGDAWFRTGDLMSKDTQGFFSFVDRIGDTFRWKGENVSTSEVADVLSAGAGVVEANVYGVAVPGADGRAGMAALVVGPGFDVAALRTHAVARLPGFARPVFLRICCGMEITATFKMKKADLARDGFDPASTADALYVDDPVVGCYRPLDGAMHARIVSGGVRI